MAKLFSGKQHIVVEVADRYRNYIRLGILNSGDKLPSVRMVAEEMGVNPNTVQKAYAELEREGYIYSLPKKGVFVSDEKTSATDEAANSDNAFDEARAAILALKRGGASESELINIVKEIFAND